MISTVRAKLVGALAGVAVLTTLLTGTFALHYSSDSLKRQKQEDELAIARNVAVQVDEVLGKARQTVEALAQHPVFSSMDAARQREALTLVTKVTEIIDGIAAVDLDGRVLAMDGAEPATENLVPPDVERFVLADIKKGRGPHFSEVFWTKSGEPLVSINVPIRREGKLRGALFGVILLKNHSLGGIEDIRIGKTGYAYLVDGRGDILRHPQRERVMENIRTRPQFQALLQRREGVIEFVNQDGVPLLAAFAPVNSTGWGIIVRQPTAESYSYAQHLRFVLSGVFFLSLVAALAAGGLLAGRISRPITGLVRGVKRVTDGDLSARLEAGGGDEIARLGAAFNEMTGRLQEKMRDIEKAHARALETERRLSRSEKLAAVGQLAAGLAHEINNPLNVMSGFCELLASRTPADDPRRAQVEEIHRECLRCQRLVRDLLDYARPKEPRREPVALADLVAETLSLVRAQAKSQGVELEAKVDPDLPPVLADADQIKQVLLNLCLNACQAMPEGGSLSLSASARGRMIALRVTDTGSGIPKEHLADIFNPFFTTKEEGAGLGLAVCHSIVESHGGSVDVESESGRGTTFIVGLPVAEVVNVPVA